MLIYSFISTYAGTEEERQSSISMTKENNFNQAEMNNLRQELEETKAKLNIAEKFV